MTQDQNPSHWTFCSARNDSLLNNYNSGVTLGWLANTDVSPSTSIHAIVNYVSKYCSKAETKSVPYKELLGAVIPLANSPYAFASIVNKFLNKLVGERDWSAQEVCHLLLGLPLSTGSRTVITLDCRPECDQGVPLEFRDGEITRKESSHYDKYKNRPE